MPISWHPAVKWNANSSTDQVRYCNLLGSVQTAFARHFLFWLFLGKILVRHGMKQVEGERLYFEGDQLLSFKIESLHNKTFLLMFYFVYFIYFLLQPKMWGKRMYTIKMMLGSWESFKTYYEWGRFGAANFCLNSIFLNTEMPDFLLTETGNSN